MNRRGEPKTYRLALASKLFLGAAGVFLPIVVVGVFIGIASGDVPPRGLWFFYVWLVFVIITTARAALRGVVRIDLDDRKLRLRAPLRTIEVAVEDVVSIETSWWDVNRFAPLIRYRGGTARLLGPLNEFYEFVSRLKELNPVIEVKRL